MYRLILLTLLLMTFAILPMAVMAEENPHNGYVFWLPAGELKIGDAASEKEFNYIKTADGCSFTIEPRATRFDIPNGQLVLVCGKAATPVALTVEDQSLGMTGVVTFIPKNLTSGKNEIKVRMTSTGNLPTRLRFYYTDDSEKLGMVLNDHYTRTDTLKNIVCPTHWTAYVDGILAFWSEDYVKATSEFKKGLASADKPESQRLFRRLIRWCDAETEFSKVKSGEGYYDLGLYSMVNGYWDLAYDCFTKATELMPKNPDAWYMLGDAASYKYSDIELKMEKCYPYYRKAADLYPKENSNTYRTYFGLFRNMKIKENDKEQVRHITDEEIEHTKKMWLWDTALMESSSRGALRLVNTFEVIDKEVDNTDPWNPKPYEGLFKPGTVETFMKMTDWGASDACGHDCGPDRSAIVNMGIRTWDTYYHEWNHTMDWTLITSELGIGVPTTHSSDWCGFEPISSMGMGHHSCNRYYTTPGMYRYIRGSDPITTPYIKDWLVTKPTEIAPPITDEQIKDEKFINDWMTQVHQKTAKVGLPAASAFTTKVEVAQDYIDLKMLFRNSPKNAYAFAKTYISSPKKQKVRVWLGADDNVRMWINGRLVHKGTTYWACALFTDCKEKDQFATGVMLEKGWNEVIVQITNAQHNIDWLGGNPPDTWGFSMRICDMYNKEVPGLTWQADMPDKFMMPVAFKLNSKSPTTYSWSKVADDYTMLTPELTIDDLRAITGYKTMTATNEIFFDLSKETLDPAIKPYAIDKADPNNVALNNELNWFFSPKEFAAVVRYKRGNETRDLLFLRPEAYESYLKLIKVPGKKNLSDSVIGYFLTERDESPNGRIVLVVDTYLGNKLPVDEEDLLSLAISY